MTYVATPLDSQKRRQPSGEEGPTDRRREHVPPVVTRTPISLCYNHSFTSPHTATKSD
uniref:Uncharacterized protein n=1 Tax=Hyaloperonospora arabidopsidis (strain Emoy2) TaxID=559515 RepID=M4BMH9_HYAAE